jgi:hypothetical protein
MSPPTIEKYCVAQQSFCGKFMSPAKIKCA